MIVLPAMRGFLGAKTPLLVFATIAPQPVLPPTGGGVTLVPCTVGVLPGGSAWIEYVSGGDTTLGSGIYTPSAGYVTGAMLTSQMANVSGWAYRSYSHNITYTILMRLRTVQNGAILGTYSFSVTTN